MTSDPASQGEQPSNPDPYQREQLARNVWSLHERRWPTLTFTIILLSLALTALAHFAEHRLPYWVYSTGYDVWGGHRYGGVFTSIFLHVGFLHLFFNCYWFWYFGRVLEPGMGTLRYLAFMAGSAWATGIGEMAVSGNPGVGLSGVLYAQFGYMLVNRQRDPVFLLLLPRSTVGVLLAWLFICIGLTYTGAMAIANGAHFAGFAIGCGVGFFARHSRGKVIPATLAFALACSWPLAWAPWQEGWLVARAAALMDARRTAEAEPLLERAVAKNPRNEWAWLILSQLHASSGRYAKARAAFVSGMPYSEGATLPNNFAWLLATCPDSAIRNGPLAVQLAKRACELTDWKNAGYIDTYAAALAESGDFGGAIDWMEKALALDPQNKVVYQLHLASFKAGKPWREEPAL